MKAVFSMVDCSVSKTIASATAERKTLASKIARLRAGRARFASALKVIDKVLKAGNHNPDTDYAYTTLHSNSWGDSVSCSAYFQVETLNDMKLKRVRGAALLQGFSEGEIKKNASEYDASIRSTLTKEIEGIVVTLDLVGRLSDSATCRKVQVGVKEVPVYEIKCD